MRLTLARLSVSSTSSAPSRSAAARTIPNALRASSLLTVSAKSVVFRTCAFCTMMSTLMSASARGSSSPADTPGRSTIPVTVIFATFASVATARALLRISPTLGSMSPLR